MSDKIKGPEIPTHPAKDSLTVQPQHGIDEDILYLKDHVSIFLQSVFAKDTAEKSLQVIKNIESEFQRMKYSESLAAAPRLSTIEAAAMMGKVISSSDQPTTAEEGGVAI